VFQLRQIPSLVNGQLRVLLSHELVASTGILDFSFVKEKTMTLKALEAAEGFTSLYADSRGTVRLLFFYRSFLPYLKLIGTDG
jgi:hypothetical protein